MRGPAGSAASCAMRPGFGFRLRIDIIVTLLPGAGLADDAERLAGPRP